MAAEEPKQRLETIRKALLHALVVDFGKAVSPEHGDLIRAVCLAERELEEIIGEMK